MSVSTLSPPRAPEAVRTNADLELLASGLPDVLGRRFVCLLAVGSVGRGYAEGASDIQAEDYDLIIVADGLGALERRMQRRAVDAVVREMSREIARPISPGILEKRTLATRPFTLFNFEMRHAHLLLAGEDATALLPEYPSEQVPLIEATRLLLNRGVLLWGAAVALQNEGRGVPEGRADQIRSDHRKTVQAIGDALLISEGLYHWSYRERMRNAERCIGLRSVPGAEDLPDRYLEALASKREGRPADAGSGSLSETTDELLHLHAATFRQIEERRLGRVIRDWGDYAAGPIEYPSWLIRPPLRRLARLLQAFGRPRSREFWRGHRKDEAESILLGAFPRLAYQDGFGSPVSGGLSASGSCVASGAGASEGYGAVRPSGILEGFGSSAPLPVSPVSPVSSISAASTLTGKSSTSTSPASAAELSRTLNWIPPRDVRPMDVWERFHAVWERAQ